MTEDQLRGFRKRISSEVLGRGSAERLEEEDQLRGWDHRISGDAGGRGSAERLVELIS